MLISTCNYCVGKSTFYNAATQAVLRGDAGRKMAEVAPHPFTTIEPNVGPGWFAGPADSETGRSATCDQ
jgi:ribosome-binding ATPase YchF (GTP1/OBG family)